MSRYQLVPLFQARVTGVAFEQLERLASPATMACLPAVDRAEATLDGAAAGALAVLRAHPGAVASEHLLATRNALGARRPLAIFDGPPELDEYRRAHQDLAAARARLERTLQDELAAARAALRQALPGLAAYVVFASEPVRRGLESLLAHPPAAVRTAEDKDRERHFLLYLQRVCAKNDTLSEFGPSGWGRLDGERRGVCIEVAPGVGRREVYYERWVASAVAAAMNADPEVLPELSPRPHLLVLRQGPLCVLPTGASLTLSHDEEALLARCDGSTPAYALAAPSALAALVDKGVLVHAVEPLSMAVDPLTALRAEIAGWRDGAAKVHWQTTLDDLLALLPAFAAVPAPAPRHQLMDQARKQLATLGATRRGGQRALYAATNPIGEDCVKEGRILVGQAMADEFVEQAAPWLDLWRDTYALATCRIAAVLRHTLTQLPRIHGRLTLAALLRHCESRGQTLERLQCQTAEAALAEVKAAFADLLRDRADQPEVSLSTADCHFVRRQFSFPSFDEFTWPSADLMIAASSPEATERGEYSWVLAELHPFVVPYTHCFYFSCPQPQIFRDALVQAAGGRPTFMFAENTTTHTFPHLCDTAPELWAWLGSRPAGVRSLPPAEVELYVDEASGDVLARYMGGGSGAELGSLTRGHWRTVGFGLHPFIFSLAPHLPRLRVGSVIVQRRTWHVHRDELPMRSFDGVSAELVRAVARLRADKGWPRHCFIRPPEQVLGRSTKSRDKDVKPIYIDFESYLFLEVFANWFAKYKTLEVTEMLPTPEQLIWQEADGRRSFELRTLIIEKRR